MKKKSIFVVALAALMLIAFTACEQPANIWNPTGKVPSNVVITQIGDFVEGQIFDSSKFSVSFAYEDTDALQPVNDANIVFKAGGESASKNVVTAGSSVSVTVKYLDEENVQRTLSSDKTVNVYPIADLTITGTVAPSWNGTAFDKEITTSDLTVVANYLDANRTKQSITLDPSEYKIHSEPQLAAGETAPSDEGETAVYEQGVYVTFGDSTKTSQNNYGMGVYAFTAAYVDDSETPVTYEWFDHQIVYGQVAPSTASGNSVVYVQRGVFDADKMIKLYKVYAPEDATALGDDYYLVPLAISGGSTAASDYLTKSLTLAAPYTTDLVDTDTSNRFGTSSTANVNFSMTYISDEGTGLYTTKTAVNGSVVIADLEKVTGEALPSGITGDCYTGEITSGSTITLRNILADYPIGSITGSTTAISADTALDLNQPYSNLLGTAVTVEVGSWKSGIETLDSGNEGLFDAAASSYGTVIFTPERTANSGSSAAQQDLTIKFVPSIQYSDSNSTTAGFTLSSIKPYVKGSTT